MTDSKRVQFGRGITLSLAYASTAAATMSLIPILPKVGQHYADTPNAAALVPLVMAIPTLALALISPLVGFATDRVGPRRTLILALALCGLSGLGAYIAGDLYLLLAWRALAGVAMAGMIVAGNTLLARYFQGAEQQKWIGYQMLIFGVIGIAVSLAAGWVGDIDWRLVLLAPCLCFLLVPLCFACLSEVRSDDAVGSFPGETSNTAAFPLLVMLGICVFSMLLSLLMFLPAYCMGFILSARGITAASQVGYASAFVALMAIPASAAFAAAAKVSMRNKLILSAAFSGAALLALLVPGLAGAFISSAFTGVAAGFAMPTLFAWTMGTPPPVFIGRALGMLQTAVYLGQFLAPVAGVALAGLIGDWPLTAVYLSVVSLALVLAAALFVGRGRAAAGSVAA